jgi:hypothetical protein
VPVSHRLLSAYRRGAADVCTPLPLAQISSRRTLGRTRREVIVRARILAAGVAAFVSLALGVPSFGAARHGPVMTGLKGSVIPDAGVNVQYHGGQVLVHPTVSYAIFWRPEVLQDGTPTSMDPAYEPLIERYLVDVGGSGLFENNTQYFKQRKHHHRRHFIENATTLGGVYEDTTPYPASRCVDPFTPGGCLDLDELVAEVRKAIDAMGWQPSLTSVFYLFTSSGEGSCAYGMCAFTHYCAFHDWTTRRASTGILWANMPYGASDPAGCGADFVPNSYDADTTINLLSHEQMETVTDPFGSGWYVGSTVEIADKCAWTYGSHPYANGQANQLWNGHPYNVQREWSNAQRGCVQHGP